MQLELGYNDPKPVKVQMYHMVMQFIGENTAAHDMMQEATMRTWLNNSDHQHFIDSGTLRTDLDFVKVKMKNKPPYKDMTPTWRVHHSEFPRPTVFGHTEGNAIEVEYGFRFSSDIPTPSHINFDNNVVEVKVAMCTMHHIEAQKVPVTSLSRRSLGVYGQFGPTLRALTTRNILG